MYVICKYYAILHRGLEHLWIWYPWAGGVAGWWVTVSGVLEPVLHGCQGKSVLGTSYLLDWFYVLRSGNDTTINSSDYKLKVREKSINFKQTIRTFLMRNGLSLDSTTLSFLKKRMFLGQAHCLALCPPTECPAGLRADVCLGACPLLRVPNSLAVLPENFTAMSKWLV